MRYWLYKNNRRDGGPSGYWGDWQNDVFSQAGTLEWGGHYSTRSAEVAKRLNEDVAAGDVVVAYQTDNKSVVGYLRVVRVAGPVDDKKLYLQPIHRLDPPFRIHDHKAGTSLETSLAVKGPVMLRDSAIKRYGILFTCPAHHNMFFAVRRRAMAIGHRTFAQSAFATSPSRQPTLTPWPPSGQ